MFLPFLQTLDHSRSDTCEEESRFSPCYDTGSRDMSEGSPATVAEGAPVRQCLGVGVAQARGRGPRKSGPKGEPARSLET